MDKQITGYILRYLLEHEFQSKADMARKLGIHQRTIQKVFENIDTAKAGTVALDKAIEYCVCNCISLDSILLNHGLNVAGEEEMRTSTEQKTEAYKLLRLERPENISDAGITMFESMLRFLQRSSAHICPNCEKWCNPWDGKHLADNLNCYIGHMAREILRGIIDTFSQTS